MFDMLDVRLYSASHYILQESRNAELLEEVDEEDIVASVSPIQKPYDRRLLTVFLGSSAALALALLAAGELYATAAVVVLFVASGFVLLFFVRWRLKVFARILKNVEVLAQKTNRALLQREALSFGLGLPSGRLHSACRLRLFLHCREMVHLLSALAEELVTMPSMIEERRRLISTFYTEEMRDLVYSPACLESSHITQRGIGTLLDLYILHRSELLRLIVLYLFRASFLSASTLVFRLIFTISTDLNGFASRFEVLQSTLSLTTRNRVKSHPTGDELKGRDGMEEVIFSLDDITNGIVNKQLSVRDVKRALQRILLMDVFCESSGHPPTKEPPIPTNLDNELIWNSKSKGLTEIPGGASLRDEVYEVIASPGNPDESDALFGDGMDFVVQKESRQLMEELRAALADRATEFAARERHALAAFYGVSDEELERIEKEHERSETAAQQQEFSSDDVHDSENEDDGETAEEVLPRQARTLPSDLLAALRHRAVAEETIGDD